MDHVLRYQDTPGVKMIVVLGEVSGIIPLLPEKDAFRTEELSLT